MLQLTSGFPFLQWSPVSAVGLMVVKAASCTGVAIAPGTSTRPAVSARSARPPLQPRRRRVLGLSSFVVVMLSLLYAAARPAGFGRVPTAAAAAGRQWATSKLPPHLPKRQWAVGPGVR